MAGNGLGLPRPACLLLAAWLLRQRCLQTKFQRLCKEKTTENIFLAGYTCLRIKARVLYILDKNCTIKLYPNPFLPFEAGSLVPRLKFALESKADLQLRSLAFRGRAWIIKTSLSLIFLMIKAQKEFQFTRFNEVYY